ncbi:ABC transporter permease [Bartonella sp. HY329]|uniref:ABC transporter permease n=1 Tax=unclassified Bartonella TaxID=2645622 RepID=UPI0021C96EBC|nr:MULTISPECIES: FtsX-like permease family protein [unclassified Bartonella]UXM95781.1 ABC transporter permease [Bartonella sp. HY329]UXN10106.1 ABC transporter permease [Bartonella sp. HY328]
MKQDHSMTGASKAVNNLSKVASFKLAFKFALREMRGGLRGFYIFLSCIALGVAAIGGVGGITDMIRHEFATQGKILLGGDLRVSMTQKEASPQELSYLESMGNVSSSLWMRTMARRSSDQTQLLAEARAVDDKYPLYGGVKVKLNDGKFSNNLYDEVKNINGTYGVVVAPLLAQRLDLNIGDKLTLGNTDFEIRGLVENEPDLLSEGFQLGLRVFLSEEAMKQTGLLQPGSLFTYTYKIAVPAAKLSEVAKFDEAAKKQFPDNLWIIRNSDNATPALTSNIERFSQFLTLVGLMALVVGGVGVANAVRAYLETKFGVIATLKSLGASGNFVIWLYLIQIVLLSFIGIAIGLVFALIIPPIVGQILNSYFPLAGGWSISYLSLLNGAAFALLTTLGFALMPLARAREIPVTTLFRAMGFSGKVKIARLYLVIVALIFGSIAFMAVFTAYDRRMAAIFIIAVIGVFIILRLLAMIIQYLAKKVSHVRAPALRLAIGNIYRPGSLTSAIVLALGLGLTLLVAIATIDGNLRRQLGETVPINAPAFFFLDIPSDGEPAFRTLIAQNDPKGELRLMPTLRARITALNNVEAKDANVAENGRWVLRGDRNITYSDNVPESTVLKEGTWWPQNYDGPPQVSMSNDEAKALGLKLGDMITVNALGRQISAKITSLREVHWDSMNMNFVMIFSPNSFRGAPHIWMGTLKKGDGKLEDVALMRAIGKDFPSVTILSVQDIITNARELIDQIGLGVRASASIALLAAILVLAGALSAGNRSRTHDAVVLKTLGATRKVLIRAFLYEYIILGVVSAVFAFIAGSAAGLAMARFRMDLDAVLLPQTGLMVLVAALVLSVGFGLIGTWRILGQKPSRWLREL